MAPAQLTLGHGRALLLDPSSFRSSFLLQPAQLRQGTAWDKLGPRYNAQTKICQWPRGEFNNSTNTRGYPSTHTTHHHPPASLGGSVCPPCFPLPSSLQPPPPSGQQLTQSHQAVIDSVTWINCLVAQGQKTPLHLFTACFHCGCPKPHRAASLGCSYRCSPSPRWKPALVPHLSVRCSSTSPNLIPWLLDAPFPKSS